MLRRLEPRIAAASSNTSRAIRALTAGRPTSSSWSSIIAAGKSRTYQRMQTRGVPGLASSRRLPSAKSVAPIAIGEEPGCPCFRAGSFGRTTAARGSGDPAATATGRRHRVAGLSRLQRNETPERLPTPFSHSSNAPVDLPLLPACLHERLVFQKPRQPNRCGLRPPSSTGHDPRPPDPRVPRRSSLRRLR
jgi:hypothetical protein